MQVLMFRATIALLLIIGVPSAGLVDCRLSPEDSARLKALNSGNVLSPQDRHHALGIFYLDQRCYAEARNAFEAVVRGEEGKETLRVSATGFLQFIDALEMLNRGELKAARGKLVQILGDYWHTALLERVPFVLADLLVQIPDPETSKFLEEQLREAPQGSWMLKAFLANRLLAEGRGAEAIAQTQAELTGELEAPRRIELQIQLAYLLFAQKRLAEAQILVASLDQEVGETVLDRGLRVNFLILAVQVWAERVRRGGDPTAAQKLGIYSQALNQLGPSVKPRGFVQ